MSAEDFDVSRGVNPLESWMLWNFGPVVEFGYKWQDVHDGKVVDVLRASGQPIELLYDHLKSDSRTETHSLKVQIMCVRHSGVFFSLGATEEEKAWHPIHLSYTHVGQLYKKDQWGRPGVPLERAFVDNIYKVALPAPGSKPWDAKKWNAAAEHVQVLIRRGGSALSPSAPLRDERVRNTHGEIIWSREYKLTSKPRYTFGDRVVELETWQKKSLVLEALWAIAKGESDKTIRNARDILEAFPKDILDDARDYEDIITSFRAKHRKEEAEKRRLAEIEASKSPEEREREEAEALRAAEKRQAAWDKARKIALAEEDIPMYEKREMRDRGMELGINAYGQVVWQPIAPPSTSKVSFPEWRSEWLER